MRRKVAQVALAVMALVWVACSAKAPVEAPTEGPNSRQEEVRVWFRAVDAPASIAADESLVLHVSGSAGPDGCYEFRRIEHTRQEAAIELMGFGVHLLDLYCTLQPAYFDGVEYRIAPPFTPGPLRLTALQPDGSSVEWVVNVLSTP